MSASTQIVDIIQTARREADSDRIHALTCGQIEKANGHAREIGRLESIVRQIEGLEAAPK